MNMGVYRGGTGEKCVVTAIFSGVIPGGKGPFVVLEKNDSQCSGRGGGGGVGGDLDDTLGV